MTLNPLNPSFQPIINTIPLKYTVLELQSVWKGKNLKHISDSNIQEITAQVFNENQASNLNSTLEDKRLLILETIDAQSLIVSICELAELLKPTQETSFENLSNLKSPEEIKAYIENSLDPIVAKHLNLHLGANLPSDWLIPQAELVHNVYLKLARSGIFNPNTPLTLQDLLNQHDFKELNGKLLQGIEGIDFLLKLSVELGSGAFSDYYGVVNMRSLTPLAIGEVRTPPMSSPSSNETQIVNEIHKELRIKDLLKQHLEENENFPFLLPIGHLTYKNKEKQLIHARLADLAENSLEDLVDHENHLEDKINVAIDLFKALAIMRKAGIIHHDIKPENILFVNGEPKLSDFGYAQIIEESIENPVMLVGTCQYFSPQKIQAAQMYEDGLLKIEEGEKLNCEEKNQLGDQMVTEGKRKCEYARKLFEDPRNDLWAAGVALFQILNQNENPPFLTNCEKNISPEIMKKYDDAVKEDSPFTSSEKTNAVMEYQFALIKQLATLTSEDVINSFPKYPENSIMSCVVQCFSSSPPSAEELARLCLEKNTL